jgi:hypothetical protein
LLLAGVVLVVVAVVLVIQVLGVASGIVLGTLAVDEVGSLGLGQLVNLGGSEASEELLGELVGDGLACSCVLVSAQANKRVLSPLEGVD